MCDMRSSFIYIYRRMTSRLVDTRRPVISARGVLVIDMGSTPSVSESVGGTGAAVKEEEKDYNKRCSEWSAVLYRLPTGEGDTPSDGDDTLYSAMLTKSGVGMVLGTFTPKEYPDPVLFLTTLYTMQMRGLEEDFGSSSSRPSRRTLGQCTVYLMAYGSVVRNYKREACDALDEDECVRAVSRLLARDFSPRIGECLLA